MPFTPPAPYNDGNIPYGSVVSTIAGTSYVLEEVDFDDPVTSIVRKNEINIPNGAVYIPDLVKFTATAQLASALTPIPTVCQVITLSYRGVSTDFIVTKVGQPRKQDQILKMKIEASVRLN